MTAETIQHYQFQEAKIRVVVKDGEPWFVANDVCAALDYSNPRDALTRLDDDEAGVVSTDVRSENGVEQSREVNIINESGLYNLVLGSRKPEAKAFKRWVTHDVLPTIRRNGAYMLAEQERGGLPQVETWQGLPVLLDAARPVAIKLGLDDADAKHMYLRLTEYVSGVVFADTLPSRIRESIVEGPSRHIKRRIHQLVVDAGAKGLPKVQLTRSTWSINARTRDQIIAELVEAGLIVEVKEGAYRKPTLFPAAFAPQMG